MNEIKVSILVPVYNAEKYISRCAESIFEQTYNNLEIIFVNDKTPDKSIEIIKNVLKNYPNRKNQTNIISHGKNKGVSATRNTLIKNATGDYVLWVDADDFIENNTVDTLVKNALQNNSDIVCFGTTVYSINGKKNLPIFSGTNPHDLIIDLLSGRIFTVLWGNLIKRQLFLDNNITFIEGLDIGEDMLVLIKLLYHSKIISTENRILYYYDDTSEYSLVRSFSIEKALMVIKILDELEDYLKDKINVSIYIQERKLDAYLSVVYGACIDRNRFRYKWAKTFLSKIDWKHIRNRKSPLYIFFIICNSYNLNRFWAYIILLLKHCVTTEKKIMGFILSISKHK